MIKRKDDVWQRSPFMSRVRVALVRESPRFSAHGRVAQLRGQYRRQGALGTSSGSTAGKLPLQTGLRVPAQASSDQTNRRSNDSSTGV
jgi:hypothetical protein